MAQLSYFSPATGSPFTPSAVSGTTITVSTTAALSQGMVVANSSYGINTTIASITNSTQFVVISATGITTSTPLNIGYWVTASTGAQGAQGYQGYQGSTGPGLFALTPSTIQTSGTYTATAYQLVLCNPISLMQVNLPTAPTAGTVVGVQNLISATAQVAFGTGGSDTIRVSGLVLSPGLHILFTYNATSAIWEPFINSVTIETELQTQLIMGAFY